jgi:hypothetical protein
MYYAFYTLVRNSMQSAPIFFQFFIVTASDAWPVGYFTTLQQIQRLFSVQRDEQISICNKRERMRKDTDDAYFK